MSRWRSILRPLPRPLFVASLLAYLILRAYLATLPGYVPDVQAYKRWAIGTAVAGLPAAYEASDVDYPPLYLYVLGGVGRLYLWVEPEHEGHIYDSRLLTWLVKTPHLAFDLLLAGLLYALVARGGLWGEDRADPGWGRLAAVIYLWNPAVLWDSGYWGQTDGVHSALALGAVAALAFERMAGAGALLAASGLMKPLAAPLVPLLAVVAWLRRGPRAFARMAAGAAVVAIAIFLPFLLTGRIVPVLERVLGDVGAMPFTSVNAHNLWWLIGGWRATDVPLLGPLDARTLGLGLFGAAYAGLLVWGVFARDLRALPAAEYRARLFVLAAAVSSAFFLLSTHMHENHLFTALPFLLAVAGRSRRLAWLTAGCSLALLLNMVLHDLSLPYHLPFGLSASAGIPNPHPGTYESYTWLQYLGSRFDALLVLAVAGGIALEACRGGGATEPGDGALEASAQA